MPLGSREEQTAYQSGYMAGRRTAWLEAHGPCVKCGGWERLEVDHVDPKHKVDHRVWSWARERREAELSKCQVLCYRCHKGKTAEQFKKPIRHGTNCGYSHYACRCDPCKRAHNEYAKELKVRQAARWAAARDARMAKMKAKESAA